MNIKERAEVVKAMETLARCINDEEIFECWLIEGVADGETDFEDYYTEDEAFKDLMTLFLRLMAAARKSGGLYCDQICSD